MICSKKKIEMLLHCHNTSVTTRVWVGIVGSRKFYNDYKPNKQALEVQPRMEREEMRRKHLVDKLRFKKHERQEVSEEQNWYNVKALRDELKSQEKVAKCWEKHSQSVHPKVLPEVSNHSVSRLLLTKKTNLQRLIRQPLATACVEFSFQRRRERKVTEALLIVI